MRYLLISPWTARLRLIRAVTSMTRPRSGSGGLWSRAWWGSIVVVVLGVLGQDVLEVLFAVDQQVAGASAA